MWNSTQAKLPQTLYYVPYSQSYLMCLKLAYLSWDNSCTIHTFVITPTQSATLHTTPALNYWIQAGHKPLIWSHTRLSSSCNTSFGHYLIGKHSALRHAAYNQIQMLWMCHKHNLYAFRPVYTHMWCTVWCKILMSKNLMNWIILLVEEKLER